MGRIKNANETLILYFLWKNRTKWFLVSEIARETMHPESTVRSILERYEKLGVVESSEEKFGKKWRFVPDVKNSAQALLFDHWFRLVSPLLDNLLKATSGV